MRPNRQQLSTRLDLDELRRDARTLKKSKGIQHATALDAVAKLYGFDRWTALVAAQNDMDRTEQRRNQQPSTHEPRFSIEDQPPDGAHVSPFENPSYVRRIFRP